MSSASRFGPFRTSPDQGTSKHAYSPFDDRGKQTQPPTGDYVPGQVMVKFKPEPSGGQLRAAPPLSTAYGITRLDPVFPNAGASGRRLQSSATPSRGLERWYRAKLSEGTKVADAVAALAKDSSVEAVEPDYVRRMAALPSASTDPRYTEQWHLAAIRAPEAWQFLESKGINPGGRRDVVVAVIDTGVDYSHPDLAANMWVNSAEFNGVAGADDDNNGFVDDIHGVNVVSTLKTGNPMDDHGHGTHIAGIIAAQANNGIGGVGVAYNTQVMAIKAAQYSGALSSSDIAEAVYYAVDKGADVINMSFGGYSKSQLEEDALAVAFGQAVLVAAAGNDGKVNLPCPLGANMYPAAYNWVLGVMARSQSPNARGDYLAGFSNFDCTPRDSSEYELMTPGVDILSTLPGGQYAAWDGTSMAAPVVSGMAALARSYFWDKNVYSSRFIMGQIASTGTTLKGITMPDGTFKSFRNSDLYTALAETPKPELSYLEHWLFDTTAQAAGNDADGIVDAGETIDLAIVIRNHWGQANDVSVNLKVRAQGAVQDDPYVTFATGKDTVNYGAVGSFNWDDNGLVYDAQGAITGVSSPFRFTVSTDTPNDHIIPFLLTMTAKNGLNLADSATYSFNARFSLVVQRGRELPRIIAENMTLTKDNYWLVPDQTLVQAGVTLSVGPGTQLQFWAGDPSDPYGRRPNAQIQVEGKLLVQGTPQEPVEMFPDPLWTSKVVKITSAGAGEVTLQYARVLNPLIGVNAEASRSEGKATLIDHSYFAQDSDTLYYWDTAAVRWQDTSPVVRSRLISNSIFHKMGNAYTYSSQTTDWSGFGIYDTSTGNLYDSSRLYLRYTRTASSSVFLKNYRNTINVSRADAAGFSADPALLFRPVFPVVRDGKTYCAISQLPRYSAYLSLDDAERFAAYLGGHVATVNDAAENDFIRNYILQNLTETRFNETYPDLAGVGSWSKTWDAFGSWFVTIGLNDLAREGTFVWASGEPVTFTAWQPGEPNNGGTSTTDEDYVTFNSSGQWYDTRNPDGSYLLEVPGELTQQQLDAARDAYVSSLAFNRFRDNAILNTWWDANRDHWMKFRSWYQYDSGAFTRKWSYYLDHNYWGTTSTTLIDAAIEDFNDDFNRPVVVYQPILTTPAATTYPFVVDFITSQGGNNVSRLGPGEATFTVTFNRDMDTSAQPQVSFGPDVPITDYTVHPIGGGWQNARTWRGTFNINPVTGDGYQLARVAGARAASDPWLVTGDDAGRFRFEIVTSGTEAMNLQATGAEGRVDLAWTQDDFEMLAGYNLYRATSQDGTYARVNPTILPAVQKTYTDTTVQPGQMYYYKFTVVKTDMTESKFSNVASAAPVDTIPPVISHTPVSAAAVGLPFQIYADVTDNVRVTAVTLYHRPGGGTTYQTRDMVKTTGNRYSATLESSLVTVPGLEYYITASDGISTVRTRPPDQPHQVAISDVPQVTGVSPNRGSSAGGTPVTVSGANFKTGASVTFGGAVASQVSLTGANQIACVTPAHFPGVVDVVVANPDSTSATLLRGFTYESSSVPVSLPDVSGNSGAIVEIPVNIENVSGLRAAQLVVQFNSNVLSARDARVGALTFGFSLERNTGTPGQITVTMAKSTTVSGSGVLAYLEFQVTGAASTSTNLTLATASLNDGAILVTPDNGTFTVGDLRQVAGDVRYYEASRAVPGVQLSLAGASSFSRSTDGQGHYAFTGIPPGNYTLTPAKSDDTAAITSYDASFILRGAAQLITLTASQQVAADVDRSGGVTPMDASYVLEKAAQLRDVPFPGAGKVWDFVPSSRSYQPLSADVSGQDFTAVLIGDVSGNWGQSGGLGSGLKSGAAATLALPNIKTLPQRRVTAALNLSLAEASLYGADIVLGYSAAAATAVSVERAALASNFSSAVNLTQAGTVRIALAGSAPIAASGTLLSTTLDVVGAPGTVSPLNIVSASFNEGAIPATLTSGSLTIVPFGDANSDLRVDARDITGVERIVAGLDAAEPGADANGDGSMNALDITRVERIIAGLG